MMFPNLGPEYYDEKHRGVLSRMEAFYTANITINQSFWGEADLDTRAEAGDASVWQSLYGNVTPQNRSNFTFNRIRRIINMISGYQRRNRKSTIVQPIENGDAETADQFTKILLWIAQQEGVLETISDAFHGSLVTGMNLLQVWMDYRSDPISGNIKVDVKHYNSFIIDSYFKKADLSDCNGIWTRTYLSKREIVSLLPDKEEEIAALYGLDSRDAKFQFMAESYNYGPKNLLTYDEFYYRDFRTQKMMVDTQTGESMEWKSQEADKLEQFLSIYPQVTMIEQEIPTVNLAIVVQGKVLYDGPQPTGLDRYPFCPVFAYYNPQTPYFPHRVQGVVRNLRDSQYLFNRRRNIELDILESQINSGWVYKEDSLVNPKDVFLSGQGRGLALKSEAMMTDVQQIQPPQIPPSMIQLSELLAKEMQEISGVSEENLGAASDDIAGVLSMLRQGAGLTTLQGLFDNLDYAQKQVGKIMIELIQTNFTPGKVQKILEGQQPQPQFYNKAFGIYHAAVEGIYTSTQKQMQFAQMLQLREMGVPIPDDSLIEACTLQNKKQLIDKMEQIQQAQQQQQQIQLQAQVEEQMARTGLAKARTIADEGLGLERVSRIQENQALAEERRAAALKDEDIGFLNLVKALKEIDDIDINQIEKLMAISGMVHASSQALKPKQPNPSITPTPVQGEPAQPQGL